MIFQTTLIDSCEIDPLEKLSGLLQAGRRHYTPLLGYPSNTKPNDILPKNSEFQETGAAALLSSGGNTLCFAAKVVKCSDSSLFPTLLCQVQQAYPCLLVVDPWLSRRQTISDDPIKGSSGLQGYFSSTQMNLFANHYVIMGQLAPWAQSLNLSGLLYYPMWRRCGIAMRDPSVSFCPSPSNHCNYPEAFKYDLLLFRRATPFTRGIRAWLRKYLIGGPLNLIHPPVRLPIFQVVEKCPENRRSS